MFQHLVPTSNGGGGTSGDDYTFVNETEQNETLGVLEEVPLQEESKSVLSRLLSMEGGGPIREAFEKIEACS